MNTEDMTYHKITVSLPPETVKKLKKLAKNESRNISNTITRLIDIADIVLDCYYCHNRENCPIKNIRKNNKK